MDTDNHPAEFEIPRLSQGSLLPRSWNVDSNCGRLVLSGEWRFRFSPTAAVPDEFATSLEFDDEAWDHIAVPSHWVLKGYGAPAYQNIKFPFPVDPPRVPTENPTGDYRVGFTVPEEWDLDGGKVSRAPLLSLLIIDPSSI